MRDTAGPITDRTAAANCERPLWSKRSAWRSVSVVVTFPEHGTIDFIEARSTCHCHSGLEFRPQDVYDVSHAVGTGSAETIDIRASDQYGRSAVGQALHNICATADATVKQDSPCPWISPAYSSM